MFDLVLKRGRVTDVAKIEADMVVGIKVRICNGGGGTRRPALDAASRRTSRC